MNLGKNEQLGKRGNLRRSQEGTSKSGSRLSSTPATASTKLIVWPAAGSGEVYLCSRGSVPSGRACPGQTSGTPKPTEAMTLRASLMVSLSTVLIGLPQPPPSPPLPPVPSWSAIHFSTIPPACLAAAPNTRPSRPAKAPPTAFRCALHASPSAVRTLFPNCRRMEYSSTSLGKSTRRWVIWRTSSASAVKKAGEPGVATRVDWGRGWGWVFM